MMQQVFNMVMSLFLAKFMLNDVPHLLDVSSLNPPVSSAGWEDAGLAELASSLRKVELSWGPHYVDGFFGTGELLPIVELPLKRYIVGYYLIASVRYSSIVVDDTYVAVKTIWRVFKKWFGTSRLEELTGETAEFIRGEMKEMVSAVDRGILLADAGGSKTELIDTFVSNEHINLGMVVSGFIDTYQKEPLYFDLALMNYYQALAEGLE